MGSAVSRPATLKVSQDQDTTTTLPREVVHLSPRAPQTPVGQVYHRLTDQEFRDVIPAPRPHRAPAVQNPRRNLTLFSPVPPRAESLSSSTIRGIRVRLFNSPSSSAQESSLPEPNDSFTQALPDDREEDGFIPAIMENTRPLSGDDSEQALSDDKEEDGFIPATMENIRLFSREDCDDDHDSSGSLHVRTKHNKTTALQTIKGKLGEEEPLTVAHYAVTASASDAEMPYFYAQLVLDQNQYTHQWSFTVRLPTQLQPDESADWLIPVSENRIEIALDELIRRQYTRHARDILFFLNQKEERDWRRLDMLRRPVQLRRAYNDPAALEEIVYAKIKMSVLDGSTDTNIKISVRFEQITKADYDEFYKNPSVRARVVNFLKSDPDPKLYCARPQF